MLYALNVFGEQYECYGIGTRSPCTLLEKKLNVVGKPKKNQHELVHDTTLKLERHELIHVASRFPPPTCHLFSNSVSVQV